MHEIILYGAGVYGKKVYEEIGDSVSFFCDADTEKINRDYCTKKVISPEELINHLSATVIVCINSAEDISVVEWLKEKEIINVITYRELEYLKLLYQEDYHRIQSSQFDSVFLVGESTDNAIASIFSLMLTKQGKKCEFITSENIDKLKDYKELSVIINQKYHLALYELIKRKIGKEFIQNIIDLNRAKRFGHEGVIVVEANPEVSTEEYWNKNNERILKDYNDIADRYIKTVGKDIPLFKLIEIETYNRCNGICSFCPVNRNEDSRVEALMKEELFEKIILELEQINYEGRISLFSNNEPLLDNRIVKFHEYARRHLPNAKIHMLTNGILLTKDLFYQLINNVDELIIDNYNQSLELIPSVKGIVEEISKNDEYINKVTVFKRRPFEVLSSRGGNAKNKKSEDYSSVKCLNPFHQIVIRPTGEVSLCCNDSLGNYTMGDLKNETLIEVWYGEKFNAVREKLSNGRSRFGNCKNCDSLHIYN